MKRKIATIALALAAVFGSVVVSAPAQADWGSVTHYAAKGGAVPSSARLGVTRMDGAQFDLELGDYMINSWRVCPELGGYRLRVTGPAGTTRDLARDQCYFPTNEGTYQYKMLVA
jgi:hypothetical protein